MEAASRFYAVFVEGGEAPRHKHMAYDEAFGEAQRLAQKHGKRCFVMEATTAIDPLYQTIVVHL